MGRRGWRSRAEAELNNIIALKMRRVIDFVLGYDDPFAFIVGAAERCANQKRPLLGYFEKK